MKYYLLLIFTFLLVSCNNSKEIINVCKVDNPLENIAWLKDFKDGFDLSASASKKKITQYTYHNETVFLIDICVDCSDNLTTLYNCNGDKICEFGGIAGVNTCPDFDKNAINEIVLWENKSLQNEIVSIDSNLYEKTKTNNYTITNVQLSGDLITIKISASGCSGGSWKAALVDANEILESQPVQRNIKLSLENNEACLAVFEKEFTFNIKMLKENYSEVLLNLKGWNTQINYN